MKGFLQAKTTRPSLKRSIDGGLGFVPVLRIPVLQHNGGRSPKFDYRNRLVGARSLQDDDAELQGDELRAALGEALELFQGSSLMSKLQVQHELEQAFADEQIGDAEGLEASFCPPQAMLNFWIEQGLSSQDAAALADELSRRGSHYTMHQISSKVQRLQRVLPDADIATLASKDPQLLDCDVNTALTNIIYLVEAFPGKDIMSFIARQPRLVWCDDLR